MAQHEADKSPINITHHLKGIEFPASREQLEQHVKKHGADKDVMATIKGMPDEKFETMADVMKAYGKERRE